MLVWSNYTESIPRHQKNKIKKLVPPPHHQNHKIKGPTRFYIPVSLRTRDKTNEFGENIVFAFLLPIIYLRSLHE